MKDKLTLRRVTEESYPDWNRLVSVSPQGSIYSTPEYLDLLCAVAGGRFTLRGVYRGAELVGGIALYLDRRPYGTAVSNRLLLYYNSLILAPAKSRYPAQNTARGLETLTLLAEDLAQLKYARLRLHNRDTLTDVRPFFSTGWTVRPGYTYVVDLTDLDQLQQRIDKNFRRLIKRCGDDGVTVTTDDDFDAFYDLHYQTHLRKGSPLYLPRDAFREYYQRLNALNLCRLFNARLPEGRVVATQLVLLGNHPVCHTVCAGADPEYLARGTTPFLRWQSFIELAKAGYHGCDLTDAELNPVTRFKSQLGAELKMNLIISRPDKFAYRIGHQLQRFYSRGHSYLRRRVKQSTN